MRYKISNFQRCRLCFEAFLSVRYCDDKETFYCRLRLAVLHKGKSSSLEHAPSLPLSAASTFSPRSLSLAINMQ